MAAGNNLLTRLVFEAEDRASGVITKLGAAIATYFAADKIAGFFGSADPAPDEWSYRRFILHYARLCADAGGVDASGENARAAAGGQHTAAAGRR
jgi:hypothetical protein